MSESDIPENKIASKIDKHSMQKDFWYKIFPFNLLKYHILTYESRYIPANIYLLKVNSRNTRRCEKCNDKNTRTTSLNVVLVFLLLTLNIFHFFSSVSIVDFEQVIASWDESI